MTSEIEADAVVLVGGRGTRLRPLTLSAPKPMLPTAGTPYLSHLFSRIRAAGIRHVVLGTSYRAEVFEEYFGDGSAHGLELEYVVEDEPLDTGGAIRNVHDRLRADHAIVFNGDILSGADLRAQLRTHVDSGADITLHLQRVSDPSRFGSVPTGPDGRVTAFLEKSPNPPTDQINAGCYVFRRSVVETIPAGRRVSVERETFPGLLADGAHLHGFVDSSYWLDVGTPEAFVQGSADLVRGVAPTAALPGPTGESLILDSASVDAAATLSGGTTVGANAVVEAGATVAGSVLFDDAVVGAGSTVERSVLGRGARVGAGAVVRGVVLGDGASVGSGCELLDGARVWPGVTLPEGAIRFSSDA
ncbi:mannose-1-phosphate guanylyltransferase [Amycolatopsis jiangsuensis]|uniref:Mannose-1-phosphate guanylyltransferase n=1 Tax=Amycolatopsis jiangsuensis TaxID=1181879 RepID=A0A840IUH8_9PSEU|nr:NDP-sugar synthase [Amycolatopsis jiangsuensis]MBB4686126.1 mannose-1-phosphate guanylyltransferase [Amycolatopsis jiangsuensis]